MTKKVIPVPTVIPDLPLSIATEASNFIFFSGQVGHVDGKGNKLEGIEAQTRQSMDNIKGILETAGASMNDVVKTTVFLTRIEDFPMMNDVYRKYFIKDPPARSTIVVAALVRPEILVEIEGIAYRA